MNDRMLACSDTVSFKHSQHNDTYSVLNDNMSFIFYIFKGLLFTNKQNKNKKNQKFLTNTVCLHIVCKKVYIYLSSRPCQVTN